jgi:adenylylsulfate kinase
VDATGCDEAGGGGAMVIWLIGLSAAGKTSVGRALVEQLRRRHDNLVFLDGDLLRQVWGDQLGHDIEGRQRNAHRISHLCRLLDQQGIHAVAAVLSLFPEWQQWNRENFSSYFEIFLDTPMAELERRDPHGLYARARAGEEPNVVGVDIPFPPPPAPDLTLAAPEVLEAPSAIAERILAALPDPLP